jgi:hypothetical protein
MNYFTAILGGGKKIVRLGARVSWEGIKLTTKEQLN